MFVEKPVELHMDAALAKQAAIESAGIVNAAGYCLRYMDTVEDLKARVVDHKIELALGYYIGSAPGSWWRTRAKSGGQLIEQSTHIVDLARYLVGDVAAVGGGFASRTPLDGAAT